MRVFSRHRKLAKTNHLPALTDYAPQLSGSVKVDELGGLSRVLRVEKVHSVFSLFKDEDLEERWANDRSGGKGGVNDTSGSVEKS